jgi:Tfp pilus assembly protein PilN
VITWADVLRAEAGMHRAEADASRAEAEAHLAKLARIEIKLAYHLQLKAEKEAEAQRLADEMAEYAKS